MLYFYSKEKPIVMGTLELRGLVKIKAVIESYKNESSDWWDEMTDEEKKEVEIGLMQSDKGQVIPHNDVMSVFDKWH